MTNVYFRKVRSGSAGETGTAARAALAALVSGEKINLSGDIPIKVHFGEKGNETFIKPSAYDGIIDFLSERGIKTCFIETNVMYAGSRHRKDLHLKTAEEHGFTRLPIIIADGDFGEDYSEVEINKKHFRTCKLGKEFSKYNQIIVASHFKGHILAGFGGAIKQLSMGFASKGGKMAMHLGVKPKIRSSKCKRCESCLPACKENAIVIGERSYIDYSRCVGCGACLGLCPNNAITVVTLKSAVNAVLGGIGNPFLEKLAEYACAAHSGRKNIYINFATDITADCDCLPKKMKAIVENIGIFASTDPVAVDRACCDAVSARGKKFRGKKIFDYAERIGLGSKEYVLKEIS